MKVSLADSVKVIFICNILENTYTRKLIRSIIKKQKKFPQKLQRIF